jgi:hypothetical protein
MILVFFKIIYNDKTETKINYKDYTKDLVNFIKQISYNYDKRFYSIIMNEVNIEKKNFIKETNIQKIELLNKFYGEIEQVKIEGETQSGQKIDYSIVNNINEGKPKIEIIKNTKTKKIRWSYNVLEKYFQKNIRI